MEVWVLVGFAEKTFWNLRSYILDEGSLIFCCMGSQVNVIFKIFAANYKSYKFNIRNYQSYGVSSKLKSLFNCNFQITN